MNKPNKLLDRIIPWRRRARDAAWLARASFERGYKSSGDDWGKAWKETPERAIMVRMGLIDKGDVWR